MTGGRFSSDPIFKFIFACADLCHQSFLFIHQVLESSSRLQFEILDVLLNLLAFSLDSFQVLWVLHALLDQGPCLVQILLLFALKLPQLVSFTHKTDFVLFLGSLQVL